MQTSARHEEKAYGKGYRVTPEGMVVNETTGESMKLQLSARGYLVFRYDKYAPKVGVHRLQAFQKFGAALYDEGMMARHLDGNPLNNRVENIEIGTHSQNMMDRPAAERAAQARKAGRASRAIVSKLSVDEIVEIRVRRAAGASLKDLAARFSVSVSMVSDISTGKKHRDKGGPIRVSRRRRLIAGPRAP